MRVISTIKKWLSNNPIIVCVIGITIIFVVDLMNDPPAPEVKLNNEARLVIDGENLAIVCLMNLEDLKEVKNGQERECPAEGRKAEINSTRTTTGTEPAE